MTLRGFAWSWIGCTIASLVAGSCFAPQYAFADQLPGKRMTRFRITTSDPFALTYANDYYTIDLGICRQDGAFCMPVWSGDLPHSVTPGQWQLDVLAYDWLGCERTVASWTERTFNISSASSALSPPSSAQPCVDPTLLPEPPFGKSAFAALATLAWLRAPSCRGSARTPRSSGARTRRPRSTA